MTEIEQLKAELKKLKAENKQLDYDVMYLTRYTMEVNYQYEQGKKELSDLKEKLET